MVTVTVIDNLEANSVRLTYDELSELRKAEQKYRESWDTITKIAKAAEDREIKYSQSRHSSKWVSYYTACVRFVTSGVVIGGSKPIIDIEYDKEN